jgi:Bacterial Ig-like domain (group 3)
LAGQANGRRRLRCRAHAGLLVHALCHADALRAQGHGRDGVRAGRDRRRRAPAGARGTPDQTSLPGNPFTGLVVNGTYEEAQAFTAGLTGYLDTVVMELDNAVSDGRFTVQIMPTSAGTGAPTGSALASRTIDGCRIPGGQFEVPFGPAASITAGSRYALVLAVVPGSGSPNNPSEPSVAWGSGNAYATGQAFTASPPSGTPTWAPAAVDDLAFATYVSASAPATLTRDATQTSIASSANPSGRGDVTFTATVTDPGHPDRVPVGTVAFRIDNNGGTFTQTLDANGEASVDFQNLPKGTSAITAAYCPASDRFVSSSATMNQTIVEDRTDITVAADPAEISVGQSTTLTATVTDTEDPDKTPTGTVEFQDAFGNPIAPAVTLLAGKATLITSSLPAGDNMISALYRSADGMFATVRGVTYVTVDRWPSQTAVTVQPAKVVAGQDATFTASVTGTASDGHRPSGSVQFTEDDGSPIDQPVALDPDGHARLVAWGYAGSYRVHARYDGDDHFAASEATVDQTIARADTATTITSSPNPVVAGGELSHGRRRRAAARRRRPRWFAAVLR